MQISVLLLTGGSLILLAGWLFLTFTASAWYSAIPVILVFTYPAILIHLLAWIRMSSATHAVPIQSRAFLASVIGFVVSLVILPWVSPAWFFPFERTWSPDTIGILLSGVFSYIPSVFAPVVVAHCIIFFVNAKGYADRLAVILTLSGLAFLALVTILSLASQVAFFLLEGLPPWFVSFAGLTSIGYALVGIGSGREAHAGGFSPRAMVA